jgi:hypothetical protein
MAVFALCEEIELETDSAAVMLRRTAVVITGAIKWGDTNFTFAQLRRLRDHTLWPPP